MNFWNDFEGKTIDDRFPLGKLLYPEGRSGFFTTSNGTGAPAVVRLTESLNDERDIFEQWETVRGLNHPHLIAIKSYGQAVLDDTPLIFAVLEPSDTSLAEVLKERPMTVEDTREIASSVLSALQELHAAGLIHGHVEPASVLAVGEVVKLRSDCVRRLPTGSEGERLKALEVQDFATLLLESLTQQRRHQSAALPAPFAEIVRNGIAGTWGFEEISKALEPEPPVIATPPPAKALNDAPEDVSLAELPAASAVDYAPQPIRATTLPAESGEPWPRPSGPWIAVGAAALLLILSVFYFLHRGSVKHPPAAAISATHSALNEQSAPSPASVAIPNPAVIPSDAANPSNETTPAQGKQIWRVVAYTYNIQEQAQHKVSTIEQHHSSLNPEVFTPTGHAPYLVTIGGPMSHDDAVALRRKAQSEGFPRDTYTQNYAK
jgi:hypothetical protein